MKSERKPVIMENGKTTDGTPQRFQNQIKKIIEIAIEIFDNILASITSNLEIKSSNVWVWLSSN